MKHMVLCVEVFCFVLFVYLFILIFLLHVHDVPMSSYILCLFSGLSPMAPVFELSSWTGLCYSIVYTSKQQTKQENSEITQCFIGYSPSFPPFPNASNKKVHSRGRGTDLQVLRYIIAQVLYFILFSLKTYKYGTIQFILIKCQPI